MRKYNTAKKNRVNKTGVLLWTLLLFFTCNTYQGLNTAALEVGMSKATVQAIVKKTMGCAQTNLYPVPNQAFATVNRGIQS